MRDLFCEKCGALLLPKQDRQAKRLLQCAVCGFRRTSSDADSYTIRHKIPHSERDTTLVVEEPNAIDQLPMVKVTCLRCGFNRASYWQQLVQTQDADPTLFYRCRQCGHTWRDEG